MTYRIAPLTCILLLSLSGMAHANTLKCADKEQEILQQIAHAKEHRNTARVAGLETALAELKANCSDEKLLEQQQQKVQEKQAKVDKATRKLEEARAKGKPDKIKDRTKDLDKAREELAKEVARLPAP